MRPSFTFKTALNLGHYLPFLIIALLLYTCRHQLYDWGNADPFQNSVSAGSVYPGEQGKHSGLSVSASASDGSLILRYVEDLVELDSDVHLEPPFRISLCFNRYAGPGSISFHLYFAGSNDEECLFSYTEGNNPFENGIFIHSAAGMEKLIDSASIVQKDSEQGVLNLELYYNGRGISIRADSDSLVYQLPIKPDRCCFKLTPGNYTAPVLLDFVRIEKTKPDGSGVPVAEGAFHTTPFFYNIPQAIDFHHKPGRVFTGAFFLLIVMALLFDRLVLSFHRYSGGISSSETRLLFLLIPLQTVLLYFARACFALPFFSLYGAIIAVTSTKFIHLVRSGFSLSGKPLSRKSRFLWTMFSLIFYLFFIGPLFISTEPASNTVLSKSALILLSAVPPVVFIGGSLFVNNSPFIFFLSVIQLFSYHLMLPFYPFTERFSFLAIGFLPWLVFIMHQTVAGSSKKRVFRYFFFIFLIAAAAGGVEISIRSHRFLNIVLDDDHHLSRLFWDLENHTDFFGKKKAGDNIVIRNQVHTREKPCGTNRIICLGSSSTHGTFASNITKSYPSVLENLLAEESSINLEVINGGIVGAPLYMLKLYLEEVLFLLDPDLVILYFGVNGDKPELESLYERLKSVKEEAPFLSTNREIAAAVKLRWDHPMLIRGVLNAVRLRLFMGAFLLAENVFSEPEESRKLSNHGIRSISVAESGSAEKIVALCVEKDINILLIPEIISEHTQPGIDLPAFCKAFQDIADDYAGEGVFFKNLYETFPPEKAMRFFVDSVHMNDDGYEHLAKLVADTIIEEGILDFSETSVSR